MAKYIYLLTLIWLIGMIEKTRRGVFYGQMRK